jgi:hypothetical protein
MRLTYTKAVFICAFVWAMVGYRLLSKGILLFSELEKGLEFGAKDQLKWFIGLSLLIGLIKGRWVLRKSADRVIRHIVSFEEPLSIRSFLPKSFYFVMIGMMFLGLSMNLLPFPILLRASIDLTVGVALLLGSLHFLKKGIMLKIAFKNL